MEVGLIRSVSFQTGGNGGELRCKTRCTAQGVLASCTKLTRVDVNLLLDRPADALDEDIVTAMFSVVVGTQIAL